MSYTAVITNQYKSIQAKYNSIFFLKFISLSIVILSILYQIVNRNPEKWFHESNNEDIDRINGTIEETSSSESSQDLENVSSKPDKFTDLAKLLLSIRDEQNPKRFNKIIIREEINADNPSIADMLDVDETGNETILARFQLSILKQELYEDGDEIIDELLNQMATMPLKSISQIMYGTQVKLLLTYIDGSRAIFKPMKCPREYQTLPNHFMFHDLERHNAEIATYHLDRALGFRRAAPVTGRILNMTSEMENICDDKVLLDNFFISPAGNHCFFGNCSQLCDIEHPICGDGGMLEGAVISLLPFHEFENVGEVHWPNPWKRVYFERLKPAWLKNDNYCNELKADPFYVPGRRLLDIIDMNILDFLTGNQDRHHYEQFLLFGNESAIVHLDHGRGFGKPFFDDLMILTPIHQCCLIRESTFERLLRFQIGPKHLSQVMKELMANDPIAPVLWEPHYAALDRRVTYILKAIRECIAKSEVN